MQAWTQLTGKMMGKLLLPGWPQSSKRCYVTPMRCQISLNIFLFYTCLCPEVSPCHFRPLFTRGLAVFDSIWSSPEYAALTSLTLTHYFHLKRLFLGGAGWGGSDFDESLYLFVVSCLLSCEVNCLQMCDWWVELCVRGNCSHQKLAACAICLRNAPPVWIINAHNGQSVRWLKGDV